MSTSKVCFAILAHAHRACLDDLVANLRAFAPAADVVLFNGGRDPRLADGLAGVDVCPYSRPLKWGNLTAFPFGVMRWLHESRRPFDFLVLLDGDMLLIKPGIERFLDDAMADSAYMAVNFMETRPDTDWTPGRTHHYHWRRVWGPIFDMPTPYQCFNPGQVCRREYVDSFMAFPRRDELIYRANRSLLPALEEMVFPTLAVALGCRPRNHPGSQVPPTRDPAAQTAAIRFRKRHAPADLARHLADPAAYLLHPVAMDIDAPERRILRTLRDGGQVDFDALSDVPPEPTVAVSPTAAATVKRRLKAIARPIYWGLRDTYLRAVPQ